ncbi:MAG TPA: hypothetical protein VJ978_02055, partial [Nitriliruptoraceae bacterium]|nr:hypothetical protein [Nitriliruptoraceae bacterium]
MTWRIASALAILAVLGAACGGGNDDEVSGAPITSSLGAAPTGPTVSAGPTSPAMAAPVDDVCTTAPDDLESVGLTALAEEPILGPAGDEAYVNPGGVVRADDTFHMLRNSFTDYPGPSSISLVTSSDGIVWEDQGSEPVLTNTDVPWADDDETIFVMSLLVDDGTWVAYLYSFDNPLNPGSIGRATASEPAGPWTVDPEPVLEPGPDGAFDERRV